MQHLQPNTTLQGGKYRIERVLGQGGFGITYLARNTVFDVNVAIKEFFMKDENDRDGSLVTMPNSTKSELFLGQKEKFKKEAKRMFAIKNEHIVAVHDLFEENGTAYYVMDYVDGENLSERLKRTDRPMTDQEVSNILPQILDALKAVHDAGIWHLDLKPANIMLDKQGQVKLIDFGASKQMDVQKGGATTSTAISYTNGYAPIEQMEQSYDKFGPWTDIYSLGATLYNLLTNKRPPKPTDINEDTSEDKHRALPMPNVSEGMKRLVLQMMNTNWMLRPKSTVAIMDVEENTIIDESQKQEIKTEPMSDLKDGVGFQKGNNDGSNGNDTPKGSFFRLAMIIALIVIIILFLSNGRSCVNSSVDNRIALDTTTLDITAIDTTTVDSSFDTGIADDTLTDKNELLNKNVGEIKYSGTDAIRIIKQYLDNAKGDNYAIPYDIFFNNKSLRENSDRVEMEEEGNYPFAKKYRSQLTIDGKPLGGIWYLALRGSRSGAVIFEIQSSTSFEGMKYIEKKIRENLSGKLLKKDTKNVSMYSYYFYKVRNGYVLLDFGVGAGQVMVDISVSQNREILESNIIEINENSEADREAIKEFFGENW